MSIFIKMVEFKNGQLIIGGNIEETDIDLKLIIRQRITTMDLVLPRTIKILPEINNEKFIFKINMEVYSDKLYKADIWDIFLESNKKIYSIDMDKFDDFNAIYIKLKNSIYEAKPYITAKKKLAIWIKQYEDYSIREFNIEDKGEALNLAFKCNNTYLSNNINNVKLCFRKRAIKELELYMSEINIPIKIYKANEYLAYINKRKFIDFNHIDGEQIWDCYLKIEYDNDYIRYEALEFKENIINENEEIEILNSVLYCGKLRKHNNKIEFTLIKNNVKAEIVDIDYRENSDVKLKCALNNKYNGVIINKLIIAERTVDNNFSRNYELDIPIEVNGGELYSEFSLDDIVVKMYKEDNLAIDIFLELIESDSGFKIRVPLSIKADEKINFEYCNIKNTDFFIKPYKTKINTLSFYIKKIIKKVSNSPIKIAIIGSCYSRSAFVSLQYFNPYYKEKYDIVYTQFHSSIPSIMSQPIKYEEKYFDNCIETHKAYVKCDFEKSIFKSLKEVKPDYIIIDLYADAVRDLIVFEDNRMITGTFILKESEYLSAIADKTRIITHESKEEFLKYWIEAVDKFVEEIKKYIPENRIILQKARMIDRYYSRNNEIKKFNNDIYLVKRSNYYFEIMEKYILNKIPNMQVINLNSFNYIGDEKFPYGLSSNHYESQYYKELVKQLDNIVLSDICNNR